MAKFTADIISQNLAVMTQDTVLDGVQNQELTLPTKERGSGEAGPPRCWKSTWEAECAVCGQSGGDVIEPAAPGRKRCPDDASRGQWWEAG